METPLAKLELAKGAKLAEFTGCLLPEVFSGFNAEYRAARESVALFDTNWHAAITLSGPDRVRYLNAILTNDIKSLAEGAGTLALLLNPQGHILAELEVYALKDKLLVLIHASVRERTIETLDKFIIMDDVALEDATAQLGSVAIEGPKAGAIFSQATGLAIEGFSEMALADVTIDAVPCHLIRHSHFGLQGGEIIAPREKLEMIWQNLHTAVHAQHGAPIGMQTLNALRLEAGIPWFPVDFNDTVIPHEAAVEGTHISFSKGCYTGQEIVERVRSRGHVNRRRTQLKFSTQIAPAAGTKLRANAAEVGYITSATFSPAAGTAIGIGYVRREHNAAGTLLEFDNGTAIVINQ
ncbi:MAG TPA: glycine cleavage T C-terminal barrel domain-containing protein [Candidatus Acidoferrales bacterium]|nr:glycine cleavage T C-terminal barrel domain-containing protein [Candidatus Acidoferrales bacterium]